MEHHDQVPEEPFTGDSGEVEKDTSQEDHSSNAASGKTEAPKSPTRQKDATGEQTPHGPTPKASDDVNGETSDDKVTPDTGNSRTSEESAAEKPLAAPEETPSESSAEAPEATPEDTPAESAAPAAETAPKESGSTAANETSGEPEEKTPEADGKETQAKPAVQQDRDAGEFDYSDLSREDLVNRLEILLDNQNVQEIRSDVEHIRVNFYRKNKQETEQKRKKFVAEGGAIEDFQPEADALEERVKELMKRYRDLKAAFNRNLEQEKQANLARKYEVIDQIKELVNSKESINKTFQEFRELQKEWRSIGLVPQQNLRDLWNNYNHNVEQFYDYIKINKELKDLDLRKNLEMKIQLCERAEALLLEPSVVNAFKTLQKYHDQWREIGPVPVENRTELWERFREATAKINRRHHEHFQELKQQQKKNLEQKLLLCEQAEEMSNLVLENHKEWDEKSKELIAIQKTWKSIGFAPKKDNNKVYDRFRTACDKFFNKRREFYAQNKEIQKNNLQLKTDLCIQAETLKDSTEWKKTTEDLINLQKKWKEIGPVPRKQSDAIWKRFRSACDHFFEKKSHYFKNIDKRYEENLEVKKNILAEVKDLKLPDNAEESFKLLNGYQRRWSEVGFVPLKEKNKLQEEFRQAINKHFDSLDVNSDKKDILKFRTKLNNMLQDPRADRKLNQERERYVNRLQQLKNDIGVWENNIGFFTRSKNAESMLNEMQSKIDRAKDTIEMLEQKVNMIDNIQADQDDDQAHS